MYHLYVIPRYDDYLMKLYAPGVSQSTPEDLIRPDPPWVKKASLAKLEDSA